MTNRTDKRTLSIRALLVDEITKQLGGIRDEVKKVADQTERANKRSAKSWGLVKKAAVAVGAAYAALKLFSFSRELNQQVDELVAVARATGETIENLSELRFAFQEAGGNGEQFRAVMSSLAAAQGAALEGAQRQVDAFGKLGVTVDDLKGKNPVDVFRAMAGGITDLNEGSEQYLELVKLFPEQWRNVINLIGDGSVAFENSLVDARKAGATITGEQARAAAAVEKGFRRVETAVQSVTRQLTVEFAPTIVSTLNQVSNILVDNRDTIAKVVAGIAKAVTVSIDIVTDAVIQLIGLIEKIPGVDLSVPLPEGSEGLQRQLRDARRAYTSVQNELNLFDQGYGVTSDGRVFVRRESADRQEVVARARALEKVIETVQDQLESFPGAELSGSLSDRLARQKAAFESTINDVRELIASGNTAAASDLAKSLVPDVRSIDRVVGPVAKQAGENAADKFTEGAKPKITAQLPQTFAEGFEQGIKRLRGELDRFDATAGQAFGAGITRAVDGLANSIAGVITGAQSMREAFRQWGVSTLQMIAQVIARLLVLRTISLFTGGGSVDVGGGGGGTASAASLQASPAALGGSGAAAVYLGPSPAAGGARNVNVNVYAWDSRDAAEGLVANRETIRSLVSDDLSSHRGFRQSVQKGAR